MGFTDALSKVSRKPNFPQRAFFCKNQLRIKHVFLSSTADKPTASKVATEHKFKVRERLNSLPRTGTVDDEKFGSKQCGMKCCDPRRSYLD